jgi:Ca-activated chloride channel family protein
MKKMYTQKSSLLLAAALLFFQGCTVQESADNTLAEKETVVGQQVVTETKKRETKNKNLPQLATTRKADAMSPRSLTQDLENTNQAFNHPPAVQYSIAKTVSGIPPVSIQPERFPPVRYDLSRESYNSISENPFIATANDPLSTFSIDVDTASYANVRRFIQSGTMPPIGSIRLEEMINYFDYDYPDPNNGPVGVNAEVGPCPWEPQNKLVRIGVKAKDLKSENLPPSNLVFLIDVSGSMNQKNKLPLLKKSMHMLTEQLTQNDRVSIVVYAGSDRVVLPPTQGDKKDILKKAINSLHSGGATHASSGIVTAYQLAQSVFMPGGNNRIILASDGDFNVGVTSRGELERLISEKRDSGVYLSVLGFGMGNYHDDAMELLADKGNGNYSYIDNLLEAKKVLVKERASTLFTVAGDVKIQVEFNSSKVGAYRLIGYENRMLADEDFNDDAKDAGEMGAGHTVTALYELLPPGTDSIPEVDQLKYQKVVHSENFTDELLNIKLRYKKKGKNDTSLLSIAVFDTGTVFDLTSDDFRFASAVASFGMLLRGSHQNSTLTYQNVISAAQKSRGIDHEGYRAEFIRIVEMAELLDQSS